MDNLEKFIRENREKLDIHEPSKGVWDKIKVRNNFRLRNIIIRISAAAVVVIAIGSALVIYITGRKAELSALPKDVREMELYYNSAASMLYVQAKPLLTSRPDVKKELDDDLLKIDNICNDIKKDLKDNVSNKEVIEALIQNYSIKIQILQEMLNTLNESEKDDKNINKKTNEL